MHLTVGHSKPVDIWAMGVITYFLLCGYTPFDRDSDFEEMQAILNADYSFTPVDYWRGVSDGAKDFIRRCLTIDPARRMTAHEALQHPFVVGYMTGDGTDKGANLLPTVKKNFNARRTLHAAIDTVRAINKLREGQAAAGLMDGAKSQEPARGGAAAGPGAAGGAKKEDSGVSMTSSRNNDSGYATQPDGDVAMSEAPPLAQNQVPVSLRPGMEVNKVVETSKGLWTPPRR